MDSQNSTTLVIAAGIGAGILGVYYLTTGRARARQPPNRAENKVYLHVSKPNKLFGLFSPNIWALKLETWLRIADIPHEVIRTETAVKYSPDGTFPYIEVWLCTS